MSHETQPTIASELAESRDLKRSPDREVRQKAVADQISRITSKLIERDHDNRVRLDPQMYGGTQPGKSLEGVTHIGSDKLNPTHIDPTPRQLAEARGRISDKTAALDRDWEMKIRNGAW